MVSFRTIRSLAQFLEINDGQIVVLLLEKHGLNPAEVSESVLCRTGLLVPLVHSLEAAGEPQVSTLVNEIVQTSGDLRNRVNPRYRYDERFADLEHCLLLDGYMITGKQLLPIYPSIVGAPPIEDDLTRELNQSGLPMAAKVAKKLSDSAQAFRSSPPNYNASLNDARVSLQTLATDIANALVAKHQGSFDATKWGSVITYLRTTGFLTDEHERGLVGVFGFVSPGSHRPLGLSEAEFARLGRSFIAGMCWFLVKLYHGSP